MTAKARIVISHGDLKNLPILDLVINFFLQMGIFTDRMGNKLINLNLKKTQTISLQDMLS